jgi:hypothetical protein
MRSSALAVGRIPAFFVGIKAPASRLCLGNKVAQHGLIFLIRDISRNMAGSYFNQHSLWLAGLVHGANIMKRQRATLNIPTAMLKQQGITSNVQNFLLIHTAKPPYKAYSGRAKPLRTRRQAAILPLGMYEMKKDEKNA